MKNSSGWRGHWLDMATRGLVNGGILFGLGIAMVPVVMADGAYGFNPIPAENQGPVRVYFGSAKDTSSNYISGVTVVLETDEVDIVTVTDGRGRFRWEFPEGLKLDNATARCSRNGFKQVKVIKRQLLKKASSPVEINCILQKI